jgi:hypothetical protein
VPHDRLVALVVVDRRVAVEDRAVELDERPHGRLGEAEQQRMGHGREDLTRVSLQQACHGAGMLVCAVGELPLSNGAFVEFVKLIYLSRGCRRR